MPARHDLIREDDVPGPVFVILEGWASRYKILPEGGRQIMAFLMPGDTCDIQVASLEIEHFGDLFGEYYDDAIYFHTPTHFLPGMAGSWQMDALRRMDVVLAIGRDDMFLENNRHLSCLLGDQGVHHQLHLWDGRAHRAGAWRKMAALYV